MTPQEYWGRPNFKVKQLSAASQVGLRCRPLKIYRQAEIGIFLFAWIFVLNGAIYLGYGIATGQLKFRIIPTVDQMRHFGASLWQHLTFNFPEGAEAKRYNVLQKVTYLVVIVILIPLQVLAGLTMSPGMNAFAPFLLDLFGGRQSARTVHFVIAGLFVLFVVVHVVMVIVSGLSNNMRAMVTGWFVILREREQGPVATGEHLEYYDCNQPASISRRRYRFGRCAGSWCRR